MGRRTSASEDLPLSELLVLGLVAEQPRHAYEIEQQIAYRRLGEWTPVGHSLVYHVVDRLRRRRWLAGRSRSGARGRPATALRPTARGWSALVAAIAGGVSTAIRDPARTELALMFAWALDPVDLAEALRRRAERVAVERTRSATAREGVERFQPATPLHAVLRAAIFEHFEAVLAADAAWSERVLARLRSAAVSGHRRGQIR